MSKSLLVVSVVLMLAFAAVAGEIDSIKVVQVEPFWYAAVEMTGSYEQHQQAFMSLYEQAGMQGLPMDAAPFGVYYSNPAEVPQAELKWEICFELPDQDSLKAPLVVKKWEFKTLASTIYKGAFSEQEFGAAHQKVMEWIAQNGYTISGPMMEKYLDMPSQNANGEWAGTINIIMPVTKN